MCAYVIENVVTFKFAFQGVLLMAHFSMSHINKEWANRNHINKGAGIWVLLCGNSTIVEALQTRFWRWKRILKRRWTFRCWLDDPWMPYLSGRRGCTPALLNEELYGLWFRIFVIIHCMLTQARCKRDPNAKNIKEWELLVVHRSNIEESSTWPSLASTFIPSVC